MILEQLKPKDSGFAGTLKQIQLIDLIQMCCHAGMSMAIRVEKDGDHGTIVIENGNIIHATNSNDFMGEEAFYQILAWKSGSFETLGAIHVPTPTINQGSQYLLMEAARIADEKSSGKDKTYPEEEKEETKPVNILIVDDSAMMCKIISDLVSEDPMINVLETAKNGEEALKKIDELKPDLITLDVNMPVMGGSTALKHIMIRSPSPVIIISNVGNQSQKNIIDFLRLGAVDFITKPKRASNMDRIKQHLSHTIKIAAQAKPDAFIRTKPLSRASAKGPLITTPCESIVVFISGAGGHTDLMRLASMLPCNDKICYLGIQNMPKEFIGNFADYLNDFCNVTVKPVEDNNPLSAGHFLLATPSNLPAVSTNGTDARPVLISTKTEDTKNQTFEGIGAWLSETAQNFSGKKMAVLLSGAEISPDTGIKSFKEKQGKILSKNTSECMVSHPLTRLTKMNIIDKETSIEDIVNEIEQL